jgi:hypothetical protein
MALKKTLSLANNFGTLNTFDNVYIRVKFVSGSKSQVCFEVDYMVGDRVIHTKMFAYQPTMDGDNFIKQAYKHLKTLPEFDGAVDC